MILTTPRLTLRRARMTDAEALHRVFTDPRAMRYWSEPPHQSLARSREWLQSMVDAPADSADDFVIVHEGAVVGKCGAWRLPEIGYILAPGLWGRGLAREALSAVIAHLFAAHPGLTQLTAEVDPRNAASLGLLARLGFHETGRAERTMQWGNEWCDSVYLALERADFRP